MGVVMVETCSGRTTRGAGLEDGKANMCSPDPSGGWGGGLQMLYVPVIV